jgi:hypothetical protein
MMRMRMSDGKERKRNIIYNLPSCTSFVNTGPAPSGPSAFLARVSTGRPSSAHLFNDKEKKESMRRDVRILLVGDGTSFFSIVVLVTKLRPHFPEGVGKSTIVTSLIKEAYVPHVRPHIMLGILA